MKKYLHIRIISLVAVIIFSLNWTINAQTPAVTVIQPSEAGIEWVIGTSNLISWTDNFMMPVNIELYKANALNSIIAASVDGSTYSWEISNTLSPGNDYKIRVSSSVTPAYYDDGLLFSLVNNLSETTVHVEQPNLGGITWVKGTTNLISWVDNIPGNVKIDLVNDVLIASDNASFAGYAGGLWGAGTNGGYGFQPWNVEYTGGTEGVVDNPANIGIIGMDNPSFHLGSSPGAHIYTDRPFSAPLQVRSTFSFDWAVNADNGGSGSKGIEIYSGYTALGTPGSKIIDIKHGTGAAITINGAAMFNTFGLNVMNLRFEYTSANNLRVYGLGRNGIELFDQTFVVAGAPNAVRFVTENIASMDANRRLYFNNLKITSPEMLIANNVEESTFLWDISESLPSGNKYKIKVSSMVDQDIKDLSDNYFTIANTESGTITVVQPSVTGITWLRGTSNLISWNDNLSGPCNIMLANHGVTPNTFQLIGSMITGSTFVWDIPENTYPIGTDYKIEIWNEDFTIVDESNSTFSLQDTPANGDISIIQPNINGITWLKGSSYLISWEDNLPGNVNIELYKNGIYYADIADNVVGSTYVWSIDPFMPTDTEYKIRIASSTDNTVDAISNYNFAVSNIPEGGSIEVLQPSVSGITWVRGSSYLISWIDNIPGNVNIVLANHGVTPNTFDVIATGVEGSTQVWDIPETTFPTGTMYKIEVWGQNSTLVGESEYYFSIQDSEANAAIDVVQPNGGEIWLIGNTYLISWTDNLNENVKIELSSDGGTSYTQIPGAESISGSTWNWNTTGLSEGTSYKIKVSSVTSSVFDESDGNFTLSNSAGGTITVNQPNGGEIWLIGSTFLISWEDNLTENVKIELSVNGGTSYSQIPGAESLSGSSWYWNTTGLTESTTCKIKVSSVTSSVDDESNSNFTLSLSAGGIITVGSPNGGENFVIGTSYLVSWTDNLTENVKIELSTNGGATYPTLLTPSGGVSGSTWNWNTTGLSAAASCKIKISSVTSSVEDVSNGNFSLILSAGGTITISQPNGGEEWNLNSTHLISWGDNVVENLDIDLLKYDHLTGDVLATYEIANDVPGTTYTWTINQAGVAAYDYYKIKIYNHLGESFGLDYSNGYFKILPAMLNLIIYPNPADQFTTVKFDEASTDTYTIALTDRFNVQVMARTVDTQNTKELRIATAELSNGVYFLTVASDKSVETKKVIVQH